jgi:hypothetical protein
VAGTACAAAAPVRPGCRSQRVGHHLRGYRHIGAHLPQPRQFTTDCHPTLSSHGCIRPLSLHHLVKPDYMIWGYAEISCERTQICRLPGSINTG